MQMLQFYCRHISNSEQRSTFDSTIVLNSICPDASKAEDPALDTKSRMRLAFCSLQDDTAQYSDRLSSQRCCHIISHLVTSRWDFMRQRLRERTGVSCFGTIFHCEFQKEDMRRLILISCLSLFISLENKDTMWERICMPLTQPLLRHRNHQGGNLTETVSSVRRSVLFFFGFSMTASQKVCGQQPIGRTQNPAIKNFFLSSTEQAVYNPKEVLDILTKSYQKIPQRR